jgi:hypothetical protein
MDTLTILKYQRCAMDKLIGFDGVEYEIGDNVELHPERRHYGLFGGVVVRTSITPKDRVHVKFDTVQDGGSVALILEEYQPTLSMPEDFLRRQ